MDIALNRALTVVSEKISRWRNETFELTHARDIQDPSPLKDANQLLQDEFGDRHCVCRNGSFLLIESTNRSVVGHVRVTRQSDFGPEKVRRMIQAGVPRPVVDHATRAAGYSTFDEVVQLSEGAKPHETATCLVNALVIRPEFRGRGLGRAVVKAAVAVADTAIASVRKDTSIHFVSIHT